MYRAPPPLTKMAPVVHLEGRAEAMIESVSVTIQDDNEASYTVRVRIGKMLLEQAVEEAKRRAVAMRDEARRRPKMAVYVVPPGRSLAFNVTGSI